MLSTLMPRRAARALAAAAALATVAACNDSTGPDEEEHADEVAAIRLSIAPAAGGTALTYTITPAGVSPSPLRVPTGESTVTATFLADDGDVVPAAELADFRFDFSSQTGLSFTRTGPFTGTLAASASAGTVLPATMCLFHLDEGHCDFGPFTQQVTIGN